MDEHDVVISYSSPDVELAGRLERGLVEAGVSVWWDRGDRTDPARGTLTEINLYLMEPLFLSTRYLVVIATGAGLASEWVPYEVSAFLHTRPVIAWHPSDDDFDPRRFRPSISVEEYEKVVAMVEHEEVIAHYENPRSEVDAVARNVAFLVRLFRFIEGRGERVDRSTVARHWEAFVAAQRGRDAFNEKDRGSSPG